MQTEFIVIIALAACALAAALGAFITALVSRFKQKGGGAEGALSHDDFVDIIDDVKRELKEKTEEQGKITRENASSSATAQTQALGAYMKNITDISDTTRRAVGENFEKLTSSLNDTVRVMGERTEQRLNALDENVRKSLEKVREDNEKQLEKVRTDNAAQLEKVRTDNALQLEKMRETVDEKLSKTLETRLGESFKTVQQSLDNVSKGLGEMRQLGEQVGNMNRLLGGVKTRGNWGEVALESLLEDILAPEQFERQCQVKRGSGERVDFAVRMPGSEGKEVLLPIDSKFPAEDYLRYADAANAGDSAAAELYLKFFKESVMKQGRSIRDKYIGAATTDFAVMYLPSESVYAEVVRDTNLMDRLRRDCSVVPCGPSTMAALLNSLKMGFTTMKLQKSSKEIAQAFGDFKKQFEKFTGLVETARKQNQTVGGTLEQIADRTGKVMKKINKIANENPEVGEEDGTALPGGDAE